MPPLHAGHTVDPAVGAPEQPVQQSLHVVGAESREHHLPNVGHAIAVRVLGVEDVRRNRDEHTVVVRNDPGRPGEALEKDRSRLEAAVSVAVFEARDLAAGRLFRIGISSHLDDVEPPMRVVADTHRVGDHRLDGHGFQVETIVNPE